MSTKLRTRLRAARKGLGLDVPSLAAQVGVSASFLYKIEQGERNPGIEDAKRIADFLGSTVDELFFNSRLDTSPNNDHEMSKAV